VCKAVATGLDILTLPSHTSHGLQPLDVAMFHPFKCNFRKYRDAWTLHHKCQGAQKEDLCQWVCLALNKALSPENIRKGFNKTGIYPLDDAAVTSKMGPAEQFEPSTALVHDESDSDDNDLGANDVGLAHINGECTRVVGD
jgi:hypothetical protein